MSYARGTAPQDQCYILKDVYDCEHSVQNIGVGVLHRLGTFCIHCSALWDIGSSDPCRHPVAVERKFYHDCPDCQEAVHEAAATLMAMSQQK